MAERLPAAAVSTALEALPEWSGGPDRIQRSVTVGEDSQDSLVDAVMRTADEVDHHPDVDRQGDTVVFTLWTHSAGGVTEKDVEFAARIDEVLTGRDATGE